MSQDEKPVDEWNLLPILAKHNATAALPEIEEKLNAFCTAYMSDHDEIKKSTFTEMFCYLSMALIDSENGKCDLRERIEEIVQSINGEKK